MSEGTIEHGGVSGEAKQNWHAMAEQALKFNVSALAQEAIRLAHDEARKNGSLSQEDKSFLERLEKWAAERAQAEARGNTDVKRSMDGKKVYKTRLPE